MPIWTSARDAYSHRHVARRAMASKAGPAGRSRAHLYRCTCCRRAPTPSSFRKTPSATGEVVTSVVNRPPGPEHPPRGTRFCPAAMLVLPAPSRLDARDIGLAAAAQRRRASVYGRNRMSSSSPPAMNWCCRETAAARPDLSSNSHALAAMAEALGAKVVNLGIVRDDLKATKRRRSQGPRRPTSSSPPAAHPSATTILSRRLSQPAGVKIDFWKIAMRPGKPFMYGRKGKLHVMGLPGNPVSALVTRASVSQTPARCAAGPAAPMRHLARHSHAPLPPTTSRAGLSSRNPCD